MVQLGGPHRQLVSLLAVEPAVHSGSHPVMMLMMMKLIISYDDDGDGDDYHGDWNKTKGPGTWLPCMGLACELVQISM